jgi:hypothetical protein
MLPEGFLQFLVRAKRNTYAAGRIPAGSSRPDSHDLTWVEEPWLYIDTYLGGYGFIGEEAVWHNGTPVWGMNYFGKMLVADFPEGFSDFLKQALLRVPLENPYRGPEEYAEGGFQYRCEFTGDLAWFKGEEVVYLDGKPVYRLDFHGGEIIQ